MKTRYLTSHCLDMQSCTAQLVMREIISRSVITLLINTIHVGWIGITMILGATITTYEYCFQESVSLGVELINLKPPACVFVG